MLDPEKRLAELCDFLVTRLAPRRIVLIGSRAKGRARPGADFDLVLEGVSLGAREERKLHEELDKIAGLYNVDLLFWERLSPEFQEIVRETGKILYEKN